MTSGLEEGEELVDDPKEIWYRHAFPDAVEDRDELGAVAFRLHPTNDHGKLSGVRSSKQTAQGAFDERLIMKPRTKGTWGVSIAELTSVFLRCIDDSAVPSSTPRPVGHAYVDMRTVASDRMKDLRQELADFANDRGRLAPLD